MDEFEWDENKRRMNLEKHYLDFFDAGYVFRGPYLRLAAKTVKGEGTLAGDWQVGRCVCRHRLYSTWVGYSPYLDVEGEKE
nr:hypothetical protein [uncultured Rhodopila sp.]